MMSNGKVLMWGIMSTIALSAIVSGCATTKVPKDNDKPITVMIAPTKGFISGALCRAKLGHIIKLADGRKLCVKNVK